jgi:hypothetical protein
MGFSARQAAFALLGFLLFAGPLHAGEIVLPYDIRPGVCPNDFATGGGWEAPGIETLHTAVLGTADFDVNQINQQGLVIVVPVGGGIGDIEVPAYSVYLEDVATPVDDDTNCNCTDEGPDGFLDLVVRFDQDAMIDALGHCGHPGDEVVLCLRGVLNDETPFHGCDCIELIGGPLATGPGTWGQTKAEYR